MPCWLGQADRKSEFEMTTTFRDGSVIRTLASLVLCDSLDLGILSHPNFLAHQSWGMLRPLFLSLKEADPLRAMTLDPVPITRDPGNPPVSKFRDGGPLESFRARLKAAELEMLTRLPEKRSSDDRSRSCEFPIGTRLYGTWE